MPFHLTATQQDLVWGRLRAVTVDVSAEEWNFLRGADTAATSQAPGKKKSKAAETAGVLSEKRRKEILILLRGLQSNGLQWKHLVESVLQQRFDNDEDRAVVAGFVDRLLAQLTPTEEEEKAVISAPEPGPTETQADLFVRAVCVGGVTAWKKSLCHLKLQSQGMELVKELMDQMALLDESMAILESDPFVDAIEACFRVATSINRSQRCCLDVVALLRVISSTKCVGDRKLPMLRWMIDKVYMGEDILLLLSSYSSFFFFFLCFPPSQKRLFSSDTLLLVATGKIQQVVGRASSLLQYEVLEQRLGEIRALLSATDASPEKAALEAEVEALEVTELADRLKETCSYFGLPGRALQPVEFLVEVTKFFDELKSAMSWAGGE